MENRFNHIIILVMVISLLTSFFGCEYDTPSEIYPIQGEPDPIITKVEPDSAVGGILEIKIMGQNFSPHTDQNIVFFGGNEAIVKNATETELNVFRPLTTSGSLMIKLAVRDAFLITEYGPYKLEQGIRQLGTFGQVKSIAMDNDENLYADRENVIYKIMPTGEISEYGTFDFTSSAMRMGPDGYLYLQKRDNRDLYRIAPGGGTAERLTRISKRVSYFDFDENDYIYSGGLKNGLFVTNPDGSSSTEIEGYAQEFMIKSVRVFNGFVYVAADTLTDDPDLSFSGIWKHEIKGNGEVGEKVHVFDWANSGNFSESMSNDITFSENGDIYVATDNLNPILIIHPDGTTETLYAGILETPAVQICWGNGNYLYMNRLGRSDDDSGIYRIVMGKKGAPYYGRQ